MLSPLPSKKTHWNRKAAARLLKVSYRTLLYKIQQYRVWSPPGSLRISIFRSACASPKASRGYARAKLRSRDNEEPRTKLAAAFLGLLMTLSADAQQAASPASGDQAPPAAQPQAPPAQEADDQYIIRPADVLAINVWKETEISRSVPVRSDGRISLPLIGDVQASGRTPRQLQDDISKKLASFISEPDVTVIVQETHAKNSMSSDKLDNRGHSYLPIYDGARCDCTGGRF